VNIRNSSNIFFGNKTDPSYFLTNYYLDAPIQVNGIAFPTSQHYYEWQRYNDPVMKQRVVSAASPDLSSQLSQKYPYLLIPNFDSDKAMLNALRAKFAQYPILARALLDTGTRPLVFHNPYDTYWADGGDGEGHNTLGNLLMIVRNEIK